MTIFRKILQLFHARNYVFACLCLYVEVPKCVSVAGICESLQGELGSRRGLIKESEGNEGACNGG